MNFLSELRAVLADLMPLDSRPIAIFSSAWPIFRELRRADPQALEDVLDTIVEAARSRSILMPTFSQGYVGGVCNLDTARSSTGILSEAFRKRPMASRTLSAFFSFAATGPDAAEVSNLMPAQAWGDGSLYAWMEECNVRFIMLGTHPTHCSYLHRFEWLARDRIPYRFVKSFSGTLIRRGVSIPCQEQLYVRVLEPEAVNDFTVLTGMLRDAGMQMVTLRGVSIAAYDARVARDSIVPALLDDPLLVLANKKDFHSKS